ncbi:WXG100 family type VII secretion target [Nocardia huaxiensis]|uniref:WXG100 family type VII secretion target n=1 Tax=Nocardia huaxiensis TaxID=2755382 RepID=A0A7D6ZH30_9NOCA|nr:hypothetical protein [Nocardia huaxiensis]QLY30759.1 hypothetical protein H0264_37670 [Nocardia huaxiensis]UFS94254.1 hypothetical protein LPY97_26265 [Nocardia huaxiensis]
MGSIWADPDRLRAVTPQFAQLGEDVHTALTALRAGIEAEGRCWGSDTPGKQFEKHYPQGDGEGSINQFLGVLAGLETALKNTGDKIATTANTLQTQDQQRADQFKQV